MRGLMLAGAAAALLSGGGAGFTLGGDNEGRRYAAVMPRNLGKTEAASREERKRAQRRSGHQRTHFAVGGGSTKLARRLRSNFLRGRNGSY